MQVIAHICLETFRNSYLIASPETREAMIIDPSGVDTRLIERIEANRYELRKVLLTSPRAIHERPVRTLRRIYPVELHCMQTPDSNIDALEIQPDQTLMMLGFSVLPISIAAFSMHTVVYRIGECLFTGDVLGAGRIGEPTSSFAMALLKAEIQEKLLSLPINTLIFPANGPPSTIEAEIRTNPYLQDTLQPHN